MRRSPDSTIMAANEFLNVPVRPAVFKYLTKNGLLQEGNVFRLTKKNKVARMLCYVLRTPSTDSQYLIDTKQDYTQVVRVAVSRQMAWMDGARHITDRGIHDFNRQVEDEIEAEFLKAVDVLLFYGVGVQIKAAALLYMTRYGFTDEDFTPDALIKAYYRWRKTPAASISIPNCPAARVAA